MSTASPNAKALLSINLPVKKPGAFQLRIAVRDVPTGRVGSANQFIEVPNLNKNRLALSGIYLAGNTNQRLSPASAAAVAENSSSTAAGSRSGENFRARCSVRPAVRRSERAWSLSTAMRRITFKWTAQPVAHNCKLRFDCSMRINRCIALRSATLPDSRALLSNYRESATWSEFEGRRLHPASDCH